MLKQLAGRIEESANRLERPILVALDGRSGTGKSTFAHNLAKLLPNSLVIQQDDFFSGGTDEGWAARTPEGRVSLCIDWKRLRREALVPLLRGEPARWHPFDFKRGEGLSDQIISAVPARIIILDGIYSCRPELHDLVKFSILLESPDDERRSRLIDGEGKEYMRAWHRTWDAAEDHYFENVIWKDRFDTRVTFSDRGYKWPITTVSPPSFSKQLVLPN